MITIDTIHIGRAYASKPCFKRNRFQTRTLSTMRGNNAQNPSMDENLLANLRMHAFLM